MLGSQYAGISAGVGGLAPPPSGPPTGARGRRSISALAFSTSAGPFGIAPGIRRMVTPQHGTGIELEGVARRGYLRTRLPLLEL